jgi:hypothetical protein
VEMGVEITLVPLGPWMAYCIGGGERSLRRRVPPVARTQWALCHLPGFDGTCEADLVPGLRGPRDPLDV